MPSETVEIIVSFNIVENLQLNSLFLTHKEIVNELLDYACSKGMTGFKRLKSKEYRGLRKRCPKLSSHHT